jgi:hypothetical protein
MKTPDENDVAMAAMSYAADNGLPIYTTTSTWQAAIQWYITITQKQ